jgi:hypothetical protein
MGGFCSSWIAVHFGSGCFIGPLGTEELSKGFVGLNGITAFMDKLMVIID